MTLFCLVPFTSYHVSRFSSTLPFSSTSGCDFLRYPCWFHSRALLATFRPGLVNSTLSFLNYFLIYLSLPCLFLKSVITNSSGPPNPQDALQENTCNFCSPLVRLQVWEPYKSTAFVGSKHCQLALCSVTLSNTLFFNENIFNTNIETEILEILRISHCSRGLWTLSPPQSAAL